VAVDGKAVADEILKFPGRRVTGPDQHEDPLLLPRGDLHERHDAVAPQVGVDRQGVDVPGGLERAADRLLAQIGPRITVGRGADVVPLAVENHQDVARSRVFDRRVEGRHPLRPVGFVESRLELDERGQRGDDVHDRAAELPEGLGHAETIGREPIEKARRQILGPGIDPHDHRIPLPPNRRHHLIREFHAGPLLLRIDSRSQ